MSDLLYIRYFRLFIIPDSSYFLPRLSSFVFSLLKVRTMLTCTPSLVGVDASDAGEVAGYLRSDLGLDGRGQLASVLEACPPMLMYHAWDNLRKKVGIFYSFIFLLFMKTLTFIAMRSNFISKFISGKLRVAQSRVLRARVGAGVDVGGGVGGVDVGSERGGSRLS